MKKTLLLLFALMSAGFSFAQTNFVLDFESDDIGQEYPTIANNPGDVTAVVEARPGGEGQALHVVNSNWNAFPQFFVALPEGKTLADVEKITFELYFESVETVGGQTPNSYKHFNYFFGEQGTSFASDKETGQTANIVGGPSDNPEKTWLTKEFVPELGDDLLSLNQFEFGFGMSINEAGNYYLDNITFVMKPAGVATYDFDSDETGKTYPVMHNWGWGDAGSSASVVADPLEINGNSLKVTVGNYDGVVYFPVILPEGFTVADIAKIQFDSYFGGTTVNAAIELFIAPKTAAIGGGTKFVTYPVYLKSSDGTGDKPAAMQVSAPDEWYNVSITKEQICDTETSNYGYQNQDGTSGALDFSAVDNLSEFMFGIGVSIVGGTTYYMDNIEFVFNDNNGITTVYPLISKAYGVAGGIVVNAANEKVSVYSIDGRLMKQAAVTGNNTTIASPQGIYIVKVGDATPEKVFVK